MSSLNQITGIIFISIPLLFIIGIMLKDCGILQTLYMLAITSVAVTLIVAGAHLLTS